MKVCPSCNLEYEDRFVFCHHCGRKLQEKIEQNFCPYCGNKIETDGEFCPFCGNSLNEADTVSIIDNVNASTDNSLNQTNNKMILPNYNDEHKNVTQKQPVYEVKDSEESFFSKRHLFTYDGRRGRKSYLIVHVFWSIIVQLSSLCLTPFVLTLGDASLIFAFVLDAIMAYPMFCNVSKRMHDLNWPTSWAAILCVLGVFLSYGLEATKPFALSSNPVLYGRLVAALFFCIPFVFLTFKKGTEGPNQYGSDPV